MKSPLETVWYLVEEFTKYPKYVFINEEKITELANKIVSEKQKLQDIVWGYPNAIKNQQTRLWHKLLVYELIAGSINYQYWYCKPCVRPNDSGATKMYELLDQAFNEPFEEADWKYVVEKFKQLLIKNRFPDIKNRIYHLDQLLNVNSSLECGFWYEFETKYCCPDANIEDALELLITTYPGFAEDMFLKRAVLFFHMLYHRTGWFKKEINKLPIAADYQIPKVLNGLGCLSYSRPLRNKIDNCELIPENSKMECEIRASSILACKKISGKSNCLMSDLDLFLWQQRKNFDHLPFHLTITTNY